MKRLSGKMVERMLLSEVEYAEEHKKIKYLNYESSLLNALQRQPWPNPSEPETHFADDLLCSFAEKLGIEDYDDIEFHTAVGCSFDKYHGVDFFFVVTNRESGTNTLVTGDVTINKKKGEKYKANAILLVDEDELDPKFDRKRYDNMLARCTDILYDAYEKVTQENKGGKSYVQRAA